MTYPLLLCECVQEHAALPPFATFLGPCCTGLGECSTLINVTNSATLEMMSELSQETLIIMKCAGLKAPQMLPSPRRMKWAHCAGHLEMLSQLAQDTLVNENCEGLKAPYPNAHLNPRIHLAG